MLNPLRALTLGGLLLFSTLGHAAPAAPDALRIGYQKGSVSMVLAKSHQLLEQRYRRFRRIGVYEENGCVIRFTEV